MLLEIGTMYWSKNDFSELSSEKISELRSILEKLSQLKNEMNSTLYSSNPRKLNDVHREVTKMIEKTVDETKKLVNA